MTQTDWPWPGDSPEDKAKRVALAYRQRLEACNPLAAAELDTYWQAHGAGWVTPAHTPLDLDEWLTPSEMADRLHIDPRRMRDWARRGQIRVMDINARRMYCVGDVIEHMRQTRLRRVSATMPP